ncbi:MAG: ISL3 family transposase [Thermoleophilia bacterium]
MGLWQEAIHARPDGDPGHLGADSHLEAGGGCAWSTVAAAVDEAMAFGLAQRDLSGVTHIGIDEISRKRGHVYVTNAYDLKTSRLLWSGEGRAKETLGAFFDCFGEEGTARLEGVCCDMWLPYIDVIKTRAPQAVLVFDKFHIVQHLTRAVDQVRRDEIHEKGLSPYTAVNSKAWL